MRYRLGSGELVSGIHLYMLVVVRRDRKMSSGCIDDIDSILARLRHLACELEEIIDYIKELRNGYDRKRFVGCNREGVKRD
jgi:hypothetical protein